MNLYSTGDRDAGEWPWSFDVAVSWQMWLVGVNVETHPREWMIHLHLGALRQLRTRDE